jgi:hypothetical protein
VHLKKKKKKETAKVNKLNLLTRKGNTKRNRIPVVQIQAFEVRWLRLKNKRKIREELNTGLTIICLGSQTTVMEGNIDGKNKAEWRLHG